ncbi:hypothetical protein ABT112_19095 [Streptomyces sp. NPDC002055]|uniref:hypothetical protein n=1 Tax=Streptomyces sp. NPDC002055 TaxID=3154534 RepID=UPI00331FB6BF
MKPAPQAPEGGQAVSGASRDRRGRHWLESLPDWLTVRALAIDTVKDAAGGTAVP